MDKILLRRKNKVLVQSTYVSAESDKKVKALVVSGLKNIESLGYTVDSELFNLMLGLNYDSFCNLYTSLIANLKELVGVDVKYNPMYPNFPAQVMDMDECELYVNAMLHYFTFGQWVPEYEKDERLPLIDDKKLKVLSIGTVYDLYEIFNNLVSSKTNLSQQDKDDMKTLIQGIGFDNLPDEIPLKENVAFVCKLILDNNGNVNDIKKYFKTPTDVLRFITALSDGDISLAADTKYKKLKRSERRLVMDLLANCNNLAEYMFKYENRWLRIGEIVHPGEFTQPKYIKVVDTFNMLRNEKKPLFFAGKVDKALIHNEIDNAVDLLSTRPGEYARLLDKLLRDTNDTNYVLEKFSKVADKVSTPVLLQVRQHFLSRNTDNRIFFPKGNVAKAVVIENNLPEISNITCKRVVDICESALDINYKLRDTLGTVYIDEELKNYIVPFSQRSASASNKQVVRGSKLPVREDATAVRAFIWWTNIPSDDWSSRVDLDLSAAYFDEDWKYINHISYTNLRDKTLEACHSGDRTNGGEPSGDGVAEFIDINIDAAKSKARYVVFQVYSYTNQPFNTIPNCRFGYMEREDVNSGEIFEPKTVEMKIDLNNPSTICVPMVLDLKENKMIWCDMNLNIERMRYGGNNLESNINGVKETCNAIVHMNKPSLYDLIMLNVKARGFKVNAKDYADIIFSNDTTKPMVIEKIENEDGSVTFTEKEKDVEIITAFDTDYIISKLL